MHFLVVLLAAVVTFTGFVASAPPGEMWWLVPQREDDCTKNLGKQKNPSCVCYMYFSNPMPYPDKYAWGCDGLDPTGRKAKFG